MKRLAYLLTLTAAIGVCSARADILTYTFTAYLAGCSYCDPNEFVGPQDDWVYGTFSYSTDLYDTVPTPGGNVEYFPTYMSLTLSTGVYSWGTYTTSDASDYQHEIISNDIFVGPDANPGSTWSVNALEFDGFTEGGYDFTFTFLPYNSSDPSYENDWAADEFPLPQDFHMANYEEVYYPTLILQTNPSQFDFDVVPTTFTFVSGTGAAPEPSTFLFAGGGALAILLSRIAQRRRRVIP